MSLERFNEMLGGTLILPERNWHQEVQGILHDSVAEQAALIASGRFDHFKRKEGEEFLAAYASDPLFVDLFVDALAEARAVTDEDDFRGHFKGAVFERMAYAYLSSLDMPEVPVMGEAVLNVVAEVAGSREFIDNGLGQVGIRGRFVPDGILVRETLDGYRIEKFIEVSLVPWVKRRKSSVKKEGFLILRGKMGDMAKDAPLVSLSPKVEDGIYLDPDEDDFIQSVQLPIDRGHMLSRFIDEVYERMKVVDGLSLEEIARLAERQYKVGLRLE